MTASTIMTVRELITLAFGDKDKNSVNFKHIETILYVMARQLSVLQRQVEISIDPQLIAQLTKTPSNISVTEVKIHATVPEELEREIFKETTPLHVQDSEKTQYNDTKAEKQSPFSTATPPESPPRDNTRKGPRVSYGGLHAKHIMSPSESLQSIEKKKPTKKIQQEKYLVVDKRESAEYTGDKTRNSRQGSETGSPKEKFKTVSVVTKKQYLELLNEIKELSEPNAIRSTKLPENEALMKEVHKSASITHPMSALILSDRLEQSEKKLQQMVSAFETLLKHFNAPAPENAQNDPVSTKQSAYDKDITVSHTCQVKSTRSSSPWKKEQYTIDSLKTQEQNIQIALTQSCRAYGDKDQQESETQIRKWQKNNNKSDSITSDIKIEEQESSHDQQVIKRRTKSLSVGISYGHLTETESMEYGRVSCMRMFKDKLVCDHEKCTSHGERLTNSSENLDENGISSCRMINLAQLTDSSRHGSEEKKITETTVIQKQNSGEQISDDSMTNLVRDELEKPILLSSYKEEKKEDTKFHFMPYVFDKDGKPYIYDKYGKSIPFSEINNFDEVYDKLGKVLPRFFNEDGTIIPWSRIGDAKQVYDETEIPLPRKTTTTLLKSHSDVSLYDNHGERVKCLDADNYETLWDKTGKIIPLIYNDDGKLIPWSKQNYFIKTIRKITPSLHHKDDNLTIRSKEFYYYMNIDKLDNIDSHTGKYAVKSTHFNKNNILVPQFIKDENDIVYDERDNVTPGNVLPILGSQLFNFNRLHDSDGKPRVKSQVENFHEIYDEQDQQVNKSTENEINKSCCKITNMTSFKIERDANNEQRVEKKVARPHVFDASYVYDEYGYKIPLTFNKDNKPIPEGKSGREEKVFDKNATLIPCVNDKENKGIGRRQLDDPGYIYVEHNYNFPVNSDNDNKSITGGKEDKAENISNKNIAHFNVLSDQRITRSQEGDDEHLDYYEHEVKSDKSENIYDQNNKCIQRAIDKDDIIDLNDIEINLYDKNGKRIQIEQMDFVDQVYDKFGLLIPRIYDGDDNPIPWSRLDTVNKIYDKNGNEIPRVYTKDGKIIPISQESEHIKVYNENGKLFQRIHDKNGKLIPLSRIQNNSKLYYKNKRDNLPVLGVEYKDNFYDEDGIPIRWSQVNNYDVVFNKEGQLVSRVYDSDVKPIPWSQMDDMPIVYDKQGKLISRAYKKNGIPIPWSLIEDQIHNETKSEGSVDYKVPQKYGDLVTKINRTKDIQQSITMPITIKTTIPIQSQDEQTKKDEYNIIVGDIPEIQSIRTQTPKTAAKQSIKLQKKRFIALKDQAKISNIIDSNKIEFDRNQLEDSNLPDFADFGIVGIKDIVPFVFDTDIMKKTDDDLVYDKDGNLISISQIDFYDEIYDQHGNVISRIYDKSGQPILWSNINDIDILYNKNGEVIPRTYNKDGKPLLEHAFGVKLDNLADPERSYNDTFVYDQDGKPISQSQLDKYDKIYDNHGNLIPRVYSKDGKRVAWSEMDKTDKVYDENGELIPIAYDQDSKPISRLQVGNHSNILDKYVNDKSRKDNDHNIYDKDGKQISWSILKEFDEVFDKDGKDVPWSEVDEKKVYYDKNGKLITSFYDEHQNPIHLSNIPLILKKLKEYDKFGKLLSPEFDHNVKQTTHLLTNDIQDKLPSQEETLRTHDVDSISLQDNNADLFYDKLVPNFYDKDGKRISLSEIDDTDIVYDRKGNPMSRVFDKYGNPIPWSEVDDADNIYDQNGQFIPQVYDKHGNPVPWSKINESDTVYDKYGNLILHAYDKDGKRIPWFKLEEADTVYDKNGKLLPQLYDEDGKLIPWSKIDDVDIVYDKNGSLITRVYDKHGNPTPWSKMDDSTEVYDKNGKLFPQFYDQKGTPIPWSKINKANKVFDKSGNFIPRVYNEKGNPVPWLKIDEDGIAYDKSGMLIPKVYHKDGKPMLRSAIDENLYDKSDILTEQQDSYLDFYDSSGMPVRRSQIHDLKEVYDKFGNLFPLSKIDEGNEREKQIRPFSLMPEFLFDKNGYPLRTSVVDNYPEVYDKHGNIIPKYYDAKGELIPWTKLKSHDRLYDKNGKLVPKTKSYYSGDEDYWENERKSRLESSDLRPSFRYSSSTFIDNVSRSYSGQKQSSTKEEETIELKVLDFAVQRELDQAMKSLQEEFENTMSSNFGRTTANAQQSLNSLTKMWEQLITALVAEINMTELDRKVAQFSQRITAIELSITLEMTRYQDEITQQQIKLETALDAMVEAVANITGDPQGIEKLTGELVITKNDIDSLSLAQRDLQDMLNNLKLDLRELRRQVHLLLSHKADRKQVSAALKGKATIAELNQVVTYDEFSGVMSEFANLMSLAYDKFNNQEHSWQMAIDEYVKCLNKKASINSVRGLSKDIMTNIKYLREKTDYLLHFVGEPRMGSTLRQMERNDTCLCCDTAVPELPVRQIAGADKDKTSPGTSKKKLKGKANGDRILCYPEEPPNHDLDPRSVFCDRYCGGPAHNAGVPAKDTAKVLIPKEIIVKPLSKKPDEKPGVDRKPCLPCNPPPTTSLQESSIPINKPEGSSSDSVTIISLDLPKD